MKNFMIANFTKGRYKIKNIRNLLNAQIENSLNLGWEINDIILLSNFEHEYLGVKASLLQLDHKCLTGSKMFGLKYLFENNLIEDDVIWAHDLDAWQNVPFSCPDFKDVGIACYSNSKFNGGSVFWRKSSKDIINVIVEEITSNSESREEPTLNKILKSKTYEERITTLNNTFNVGCSGYAKRWERSLKPIRVCHFHPYNGTAWETHALDRNGLNVKGISDRLEILLRKYYPNLSSELSPDGKKAQIDKRALRSGNQNMSQKTNNALSLEQFNFNDLKFKSRKTRSHKVNLNLLGKPVLPGASFSEWFSSLPSFLGVSNLKKTVNAIISARNANRPVIFAFGGHVIKTGCSPLIIDLIERGIITAIATNGSGAIHDLELAETGQTSEDVSESIKDGTFGMVSETCEQMNEAVNRGSELGLGRALGELILERNSPYFHMSLFAAAAKAKIPATIHVAIGTDTVHMHPKLNGASLGLSTLVDFRLICSTVTQLGGSDENQSGGVWLNVGSAVILPEIFLKAVSIARNLGYTLNGMYTVNFDMIQHYRTNQNVIIRPVSPGFGWSITGHHEILLPMLRQGIVEQIV